jgi:antitoxin MazE
VGLLHQRGLRRDDFDASSRLSAAVSTSVCSTVSVCKTGLASIERLCGVRRFAQRHLAAFPATRLGRTYQPALIQWKYEGTMVKKLTKHGNSLALVIDRPILDLLKIDTETPLDLSTDGHRLIVAPAEQSARRQKFEAAQRTAQKRYRKTFKRLAE